MSKKTYYSFSNSSRYRASYHGVDSIFSWTLFIFLLIGFALFCWMGSFYVFGHPEKAANYRLLKRLHKLEEPQRFEVATVPRGEFFKPAQLLEHFAHLEPGELQQTNETLLRNFLRNYHQTHDLVPYAVGTYKIVALAPLSEQNLFFPGFTALLQATDQPEVLLEQVFTTDSTNLATLEASLKVGEEVKLEKPTDFSAVIFVEYLPQGRIKLTTIPLLYGSYGSKENGTYFTLQPPSHLNIDGGLPLITASEIRALSQQGFGNFNNLPVSQKELTPLSGMDKKTASNKEPLSISGKEAATLKPSSAEPTVAAAIPVNVPAVLPAIPLSTPIKPAPPKPTPTPVATPLATPARPPQPSPTPSPDGPETPETKKTLSFSDSLTTTAALPKALSSPTVVSTNQASSSTPLVNSPGGWTLYEAGKMPRGRLVAPEQIAALGEQGLAGELLYLQGDFVSTASGLDRAVLRYQAASSGLPLSRIGKIRIIALFPTGIAPPPEGSSVTRDNLHPFMITDIKKENDGTVNLYVREITK